VVQAARVEEDDEEDEEEEERCSSVGGAADGCLAGSSANNCRRVDEESDDDACEAEAGPGGVCPLCVLGVDDDDDDDAAGDARMEWPLGALSLSSSSLWLLCSSLFERSLMMIVSLAGSLALSMEIISPRSAMVLLALLPLIMLS
jgi:hypothetical protein